jgi:hypothetical protein
MKPLLLLSLPLLFCHCASNQPTTQIVGQFDPGGIHQTVPAEFAAGYAEGINKHAWGDYWSVRHEQSIRGRLP